MSQKGVFAERQGLYVFVPSDDMMVPKNKKDFKPKIF
jgi:hypothetical protein